MLTDLERAEQALRDAGFDYLGVHPDGGTRWRNGYLANEKVQHVALYDDQVVLEMYGLSCEDLVCYLTAPALVQTLVDALKEFQFSSWMLDETWFDNARIGPVRVGSVRKARKALTAAEQANLPRLYSMEEIRQRMDEVFSEFKDSLSNDAVSHAFHLLAERLEKPR